MENKLDENRKYEYLTGFVVNAKIGINAHSPDDARVLVEKILKKLEMPISITSVEH